MDIRATDTPDIIGKLTLLQARCFTYLLQSIDPSLHHFIVTHETPRAIWQALENQYNRQNNLNIHKQFKEFLNIKYSESGSIKDPLVLFESQWASIANWTNQSSVTDANKLAWALRTIFRSSEVKASLLLASLPNSMNNIVEKLQTKDNLTYESAYNHLMDLRSSSSETAYKAASKTCTFCQKAGHLWADCHSRKRREEAKKRNSEKEKGSERAQVADGDSETALTVRLPLSEAPPISALSKSNALYWVLDSGATSHMTSNPGLFAHLRKRGGFVRIGDGSRIKIEGVGTMRLACEGDVTIALRDCLYVPDLGDVSLMSIRKCQRNGFYVIGHDDVLEVRRTTSGPTICLGRDTGKGLFELQLQPWFRQQLERSTIGPGYTVSSTGEHGLLTYRDWYTALGHSEVVPPKLYGDGHLVPVRPKGFHCRECALSKNTHRKPAQLRAFRSSRPFELIHTDLSGKFSRPSFGKGLYYITFIDDFTRYAWVIILRHKDDAFSAIREYIAMVERQFDAKVARLRCDGGGEYVGGEVRGWLTSLGVIMEVSPPYSHESNGVAERFH